MPQDADAPATADASADETVEKPVVVSRIDDKDEHDIRVQQIIDELARTSEGRPHADVVAELVDRIAGAGLQAMPRPWLDAVAASAICGNAYVVSRTSAALSDVPQPETRARQEEIT
ncbi:hypothetical protein [Humibacillus xanthopallidus]|uniref:Uncharacterized protein n=1 Tax=Humibacillus xanthopallidus TaxID=412689 RepID=A0A543I0T0_9MICO|nr:hypothetical protein [Humibacillus xanthopallidus]TQM64196.1 hypothetical protein FBY41_0558 [Humibacillus xanthopallidus]